VGLGVTPTPTSGGDGGIESHKTCGGDFPPGDRGGLGPRGAVGAEEAADLRSFSRIELTRRLPGGGGRRARLSGHASSRNYGSPS